MFEFRQLSFLLWISDFLLNKTFDVKFQSIVSTQNMTALILSSSSGIFYKFLLIAFDIVNSWLSPNQRQGAVESIQQHRVLSS